MNGNKTQPTDDSVAAFFAALPVAHQRDDCRALDALMREATGEAPVLWGKIVGYGAYHYRYPSGREGDAPLLAFAPRAGKLTLYGIDLNDAEGLRRLGKHTTGKGCLYLTSLADCDCGVLVELLRRAFTIAHQRHT
jgi:hypothetical protein